MKLRRLTPAIVLIVLVGGFPGGASADTWLHPWTVRHEDVLHDVQALTHSGDVGTVAPSPQRVEGVLRRIDVNHLTGSQQRISTLVAFRDLAAFVAGEST